jgi:hypothetical protein
LLDIGIGENVPDIGIGEGVNPTLPIGEGDAITFGEGEVAIAAVLIRVGNCRFFVPGEGDCASIDTGEGEERGELLLRTPVFVGVGLRTFLMRPCLKFCSRDWHRLEQ